jgi:hypothetical protein
MPNFPIGGEAEQADYLRPPRGAYPGDPNVDADALLPPATGTGPLDRTPDTDDPEKNRFPRAPFENVNLPIAQEETGSLAEKAGFGSLDLGDDRTALTNEQYDGAIDKSKQDQTAVLTAYTRGYADELTRHGRSLPRSWDQLPSTPRNAASQMVSAFVPALAALALFGSKAVKSNARNVMAAFTGYLTAMNTNNGELAKLHAAKARGGLAALDKQHDRDMEEIGGILGTDLPAKDKLAALNGIATAHDNKFVKGLIDRNDLPNIVKWYEHSMTAGDDVKKKTRAADEPRVSQKTIQAILRGDEPLPKRNSKANAALIDAVYEADENYSPSRYTEKHPKGEGKGPTATERRNMGAAEAVAELRAGRPATYGGYDYTPADLKELQEMKVVPGEGLPPKKRTLAKLLEEAGAAPKAAPPRPAAPTAPAAPGRPAAPATSGAGVTVPPGTAEAPEGAIPVPPGFKDMEEGGYTYSEKGTQWLVRHGPWLLPIPESMVPPAKIRERDDMRKLREEERARAQRTQEQQGAVGSYP